MARWWFLIVALVVSAAAACQQQGEQVGTTEETPAVDPAQVEQQIRTDADRYEQAALAGDVQTLASFYTDDAILMPPGLPLAEGIDAVRSTYQQMYAAGNPTAASLDQKTIVISESGDIAYEVGTFSFTGPGPQGTPVTDNGKYLAVWKPTETGEWKIVVDIWNSDAAPGGPAGTTAPGQEPAAQPTTPPGQ